MDAPHDDKNSLGFDLAACAKRNEIRERLLTCGALLFLIGVLGYAQSLKGHDNVVDVYLRVADLHLPLAAPIVLCAAGIAYQAFKIATAKRTTGRRPEGELQ